MLKLLSDVDKSGGIVSIAQLLSQEHWRDSIELALRYGSLVRVRNGWVASQSVPVPILAAWRVGGVLACRSAVEYQFGREVGDPLHILVPANSARLRSPKDHRRPLGADEAVIHWSATIFSQLVVPLGAALAQAGQCRQASRNRETSRVEDSGDNL